jgi:transmembrane sensor
MSPINRGEAAEERAWDALGTVADHPQVRAWLAEADALADSTSLGPGPGLRRRAWGIAASALLALCVALGGYWYWSPDRYQTGVGEQRDVTLADGSRMTLNTDTSVAVRYSRGRRFIQMQRGETLFSVKADPSRPFDVAAAGTLTRALGTEFNVDLRSTKVTVSVLEGAVQVARKGLGAAPVAALAKGQSVEIRLPTARNVPSPSGGERVSESGSAEVVRPADLKRIDAWRTRRLEFTDTPLTEAVEEFNRYSPLRVVVGTPDLASVRVSGVFRIGDAEGFLYSLREALKLETHEGSGDVVLVRSGH